MINKKHPRIYVLSIGRQYRQIKFSRNIGNIQYYISKGKITTTREDIDNLEYMCIEGNTS